MDINSFLNCPARDGTKYVANFTDPATGLTLSYYLLTAKMELRECLKLVQKDYHAKFNLGKWKTLFCYGEKVLALKLGDEILKELDFELIKSPADVPELYGIAEEVNKWLECTAMAMLHHSGRGAAFWWDCHEYAVIIKSAMPCKGVNGMMSSIERLTGNVPDISHIKVWGCKAWVLLEPRVENRKDFHAQSVVDFLVGLSHSPIGWNIWVPELNGIRTTSTNVKFDKSIPPPE